MTYQNSQISKVTNSNVKCLFPSTVTHWKTDELGRENGSITFPTRCGWCWGCETTVLNDLNGQIGAEALTCTHIDFVTLTYDQKRGPHQRFAAKVRCADDLQKWQKLLRQKEHRELVAYNKRQSDPSKLVDTSQSYVKFVASHEHGTSGTKRSHWHILVLWKGHFQVDRESILEGDLTQCMPQNERVWDLPAKYGPRADRLPKGANDPEIIDFTVDENGRQEHYSWPHGQVNWQRTTHYVQQEGQPLKPVRELPASVSYLNKYIRKKGEWFKGLPKKQQNWTKEQAEMYAATIKRNVTRTRSRGLGDTYAFEYGKKNGRSGVPMKKLQYRLRGFHVKRSPASVAKFQGKLLAQGVSAMTVETLTDHRMIFEMKGAMAAKAFEGFLAARPDHRDAEIGDAFLRAKMQFHSNNARKFLKSHDAEVLRLCQSEPEKMIAPLPESLNPIEIYATVNGVLKNGKNERGHVESPVFVKPLERWQQRELEIKHIEQRYAAARRKFNVDEREKRAVSALPIEALESDEIYAARPKQETPRFKRSFDVEHVERVLDEMAVQSVDCDETWAAFQYAQEYITKLERTENNLPPGTLVHMSVPSDVLLNWVNSCDDFGFPDLREQLIQKHCEVIHPQKDRWGRQNGSYRVVVAPDGSVHAQRLAYSPTGRVVGVEPFQKEITSGPDKGKTYEADKLIIKKGFSKWFSKQCKTEQQIRQAFDGSAIVPIPTNDPVFLGAAPLKKGQRAPKWSHLYGAA